MNDNTLRFKIDSTKIATYPAILKVFFATNDGKVWKQTTNTAFNQYPKTHIIEVTEYVPSNWQTLSIEELDLIVATKALDDLIEFTNKDNE